jgi:hypothetical protein
VDSTADAPPGCSYPYPRSSDERYLPKRYRPAPAFVIDSTGRRSRRIDLAIFGNLYPPPLFPHDSGLHVPAGSMSTAPAAGPLRYARSLRSRREEEADSSASSR